MDIEVMDTTANTTYLGRALSLVDTHDTELQHRIGKAWAKSGFFRNELTDKDVPLHLRLKLFHSVVAPTVLIIWKLFMGHDQRPGATTGNSTT